MNRQPVGAICLAVFRPKPQLLERQLRSIADQTLRAWHCHLAVDGHDPHTVQLLAELVGGDERFSIHHFQNNVGFYRNFERLLMLVEADCPWVALADQDDRWHADKLEVLVPAVVNRSRTAVSGQAWIVDESGHRIGSTARQLPSIEGLILDNQFTGSISVFGRDVVSRAIPFPPPTDVAYHDHWLGALAMALGDVEISSVVVQDYVQHGSNQLGEEVAGRRLSRLKTLVSLGRRNGGSLRYLAEHRWRWR